MFSQAGQHPFSESERGGLDFLYTGEERSEGKDTRAEAEEGLPSFVSSGPPRSEGEALLHRIFKHPSPSGRGTG
jgi:hypothetical protein